MKSFDERMREDRRAFILKLLSGQSSYQMNSSNLYAAVDFYQFPVTRFELMDDLHFLADGGLVRLHSLVEGIFGVELTSAGMEVVRGVQTIAGVSRPVPR